MSPFLIVKRFELQMDLALYKINILLHQHTLNSVNMSLECDAIFHTKSASKRAQLGIGRFGGRIYATITLGKLASNKPYQANRLIIASLVNCKCVHSYVLHSKPV